MESDLEQQHQHPELRQCRKHRIGGIEDAEERWTEHTPATSSPSTAG